MRKPTKVSKEYFIEVARGHSSRISPSDVEKLRKVLNDITCEGKIPDSTEMEYFLDIVGTYKLSTEKVFIKGELSDFKQYDEPAAQPGPPWDNIQRPLFCPHDFVYELARSLCVFLGEKKDNPKRIKECLMCRNFFIAKDVKRIICYKKPCYNNYHAQDMMKRRRKLAKKIY